MKTRTQRKLQSSSVNLNRREPVEGSDVNFAPKALLSVFRWPCNSENRRDHPLSVESGINRAPESKDRDGRAQTLESI